MHSEKKKLHFAQTSSVVAMNRLLLKWGITRSGKLFCSSMEERRKFSKSFIPKTNFLVNATVEREILRLWVDFLRVFPHCFRIKNRKFYKFFLIFCGENSPKKNLKRFSRDFYENAVFSLRDRHRFSNNDDHHFCDIIDIFKIFSQHAFLIFLIEYFLQLKNNFAFYF